MFVTKYKFLQILAIILLIWSITGGLLLPLSPAIETADFKRGDDVLTCRASIPRLKENIEKFYLRIPIDKKKNEYLSAQTISRDSNGDYLVHFDLPERYTSVQKGQGLDLVAATRSAGYLNYFLAYYADSSLNQKKIAHTSIPKLETPFRLSFPNRNILEESIRNLFFHVPMWFTMMALLLFSLVHSILFLHSGKIIHDQHASISAKVAIWFGILGLLTGMVWAKYTWGAFWPKYDSKLDGAAAGMLAYFAYLILRGSIVDKIKVAKVSAVYNVFAFVIYVVFIWIIPRLKNSLHPGNGGNPGFNIYEQDEVMRLFFYPAVIAWILIAFWIKELYQKVERL